MRLALLFLLGWSLSLSIDDGSGLDPHGGVRPASISGDYGCGIDPNGGCGASFDTDEGNGLDPHG
jgi:hypothetical protein